MYIFHALRLGTIFTKRKNYFLKLALVWTSDLNQALYPLRWIPSLHISEISLWFIGSYWAAIVWDGYSTSFPSGRLIITGFFFPKAITKSIKVSLGWQTNLVLDRCLLLWIWQTGVVEDQDLTDHEIFDTTKSETDYHRSKDMKRVTITVKDPTGVSEMKLFLILSIEMEKLERRLGISGPHETQQWLVIRW